jgi:hypothetical protein
MITKQYGDDSSITTIATPSQRFMCALGDWLVAAEAKPVSQRGHVLLAYDYRPFKAEFDGGNVGVILRSTAPTVVEIQSLISYPDRRGYGTQVMQRLCGVADDTGVVLWLVAVPFGRKREHIPLSKLRAFYKRFAFFGLRSVNSAWVNGFHRWDRASFRYPMMRTALSPHPQQVKDEPLIEMKALHRKAITA